MKMELSQTETQKSGNHHSLYRGSGFEFPTAILLFAAYFLLSHPLHAESAGPTSGETHYFSWEDRGAPAYPAEKLSSSGTLLLSGGESSPSLAIGELSRPVAPTDSLSRSQPPTWESNSIHHALSPFATSAIFGLIVLFILSINIDSLAKQERLLDFIALSFASAAEALKQMATPKRRRQWTSRPQ